MFKRKTIPKKVRKTLAKQHYAPAGEHSAVQVCRWTKRSLRDEGECYKAKFYGIKSHLCCQMSPAVMWCQNQCLHCWRAIELNLGTKIRKIDKPEEIIDKAIKAQQRLLNGFPSSPKLNKKKFAEAQEPMQFAISLSGEPTLYPHITELILELRKRGKTSFLVTNGLLPEKLEELKEKNALPTQLYISLNYPNEALFRQITKNKNKNAWKKFIQSLKLMSKLKTRTVLRMTLVRDLNMHSPKEYAELIKLADPDFVEIKGYISVGFARQRLGYDKMPTHEEVKEFSKELLKHLKSSKFKFLDEKIESKVVLLGKNKRKMKIKKHQRVY